MRICALCPQRRALIGPVAQWLEPAAHNGLVAGSSPARPTTLRRAFFAEPAEMSHPWMKIVAGASRSARTRWMKDAAP